MINTLFSKTTPFLIKFQKNGVRDRIIIKAKTEEDARYKFNRKFGFVEEFSIEILNKEENNQK